LGNLKSRYIVAAFFDEDDVSWILAKATLVVARSGANTVGELMSVGKQAILVPLPWAGGGEQEKNALMMARAGAAEVLEQEKATPETLFIHIQERMKHPQEASPMHFAEDPSDKIVSEIASFVSYHGR
jgi:UDP-N-acetylglucosamine--N-acetylmuramyl-(pentapeptide) pyrophosphoryl-undecaprenol N-acetylglucosamine transferase